MPSTARCLVRGSINIDEFFGLSHIVRPGETISSTSYTKRAGGKGANQAFAVAKGAAAVDLDGSIGKDGGWVRDMLQQGGVGVETVRVVDDEVTGRAIIQSAADGENSIVLHKGANFSTAGRSSSPDLSRYSHLLLQNEIPLDDTLRHIRTAQSLGIVSVFNPSPMLTPDELRAFPWDCLSWLIVNEGELLDLLAAFGLRGFSAAAGGGDNQAGGDELKESAKKDVLSLRQAESFSSSVGIICTLGAQGILCLQPGSGTDNEVMYLEAAKVKDKVRDTTGAGDCFAGYFVAGLMRGESVKEALQTCLTACAMCVEKPGAMESYATLAEVRERMGA